MDRLGRVVEMSVKLWSSLSLRPRRPAWRVSAIREKNTFPGGSGSCTAGCPRAAGPCLSQGLAPAVCTVSGNTHKLFGGSLCALPGTFSLLFFLKKKCPWGTFK